MGGTTTSDVSGKMSLFNQPIWLVGFRPFFVFAFLSGALLPLLWALVYSGTVSFGQTGLTPFQWHAHEMIFGFGWAVLGGFLLTASKNWLKIRGLHGAPLFLVASLWCFERWALFSFEALNQIFLGWGSLVVRLSVVFIGIYVIWCLIRYRKQDSFRDNWFFVFGLSLLIAAKLLLLSKQYYLEGWMMALGVFRLAFAVMFERTMTQFMKNSAGVILPRKPWMDLPIKALVLLLVFAAFLPSSVAAAVSIIAGLLLLFRFFLWSPRIGFQKFEIAIMYVGYLALTVHFFFEAMRLSGTFSGIGTLSVHIFTFLCMGVVIPGMMIRISQGHTGRPLLFAASDRLGLSAMFFAAFARLVLTQLLPSLYQTWIAVAALGWSLCFILIGYRLIPFLFQMRVDGKVH